MTETEAKMGELLAKIQRSTKVKDKAMQMRLILKDPVAQRQCDTQISEQEKYIDYFSKELSLLRAKLSLESTMAAGDDTSRPKTDADQKRPTSQTTPVKPFADPNTAGDDLVSMETGTSKKYSTLELLMTDTPINRSKISLKLHELEYKIEVEKKVQDGIKNMSRSLESVSIDRKNKIELSEKKNESDEKMSLLSRSARKYKGLYIGEQEDDEETVLESMNSNDLRTVKRFHRDAYRPVTGKLTLSIEKAAHLVHAPTRLMPESQTAVMVKVGGVERAKTRLSKQDEWAHKCEIDVDKAAEIELVVYEESGDNTLPIGLTWFKISDITEHLRRQKLTQEQGDTNWVPADVAKQQQEDVHDEDPNLNLDRNYSIIKGSRVEIASEGVSGWFDVEPFGQIYLHINFVRENVNRRQMDKLGRAGAVRERKLDIHETKGHQFVARKYYHIMKCALCQDFMTSPTFQCKDCNLACHKKCFTRVITRCRSGSPHASKQDSEELNHHIPHRFGPLKNIGASWCCHCGFMLPIGFSGARRCADCGIACHTRCTKFVPDLCGMSLERANKLLKEMKAANDRKTLILEKGMSNLFPNFHRASLGASQSQTDLPIPQSSLSTPTAKKPAIPRPYSMFQDLSSYNSLAGSPSPNPSLHMNPLTTAPHRHSHAFHLSSTFGRSKDRIATPVQISRKVGLDDFNFLAVLGKGNFGKVMLAEEKYTNQLYAIKILRKRFVIDNDEVASTRVEKRIFMTANHDQHPFLVNLHSAFQTITRVYFVMEYVNGGDLMMHIQREAFSEKRARFYACEVLLALEYFHRHGIIYRDLKLDNIMLCSDGHIKLADYGLCKDNMGINDTTNTFCGTPEFMAPEIILEQSYTRAVDWWAFGVLLYEMLLGQPPFRGEDEDEVFDAVTSLDYEVLYPINMSKHSVSICQQLLERKPRFRLGSGKSDGHEIRSHPFFSGIDWDDVLAKKVKPPFYPTVLGRADTSNFDEEFTREIPILTPVNARLTDDEQAEFTGFSYIADWAV